MSTQGNSDQFEHFTDIKTFLDQDAFEVHGVMFTNSDLVQSLMYISPFCYSVVQNKYNPTGVNSFMITINTDEQIIMCSAGRQSKARPSSKQGKDMNTLMRHKETGAITFFFTSGYLFDNFKFQKPKPENDGKFILEQTGDLILFKQDLEDLISKA